MMKVKMGALLMDLDGDVLKREGKNKELVDTTLKWACIQALLGLYRDEQDMDGEEKAKRYELARRLTVEAEPDLSVDELAKLKKLVGKAFGPSLVGPAYQLLEGK